jgi:hypothetical protein
VRSAGTSEVVVVGRTVVVVVGSGEVVVVGRTVVVVVGSGEVVVVGGSVVVVEVVEEGGGGRVRVVLGEVT